MRYQQLVLKTIADTRLPRIKSRNNGQLLVSPFGSIDGEIVLTHVVASAEPIAIEQVYAGSRQGGNNVS
jgi:hypothetical protein